MRRRGDDGDAHLAERDRPDAMDDGDPPDAEPLLGLGGDRSEDAQGHRLVGLVVEPLDRPSGVAGRLRLLARRRRAGGDAGPAEEADDPAVLGDRQAIGQLAEDGGTERLLPQFDDPDRRAPSRRAWPAASAMSGAGGTAAHRRDAGELVAVGRISVAAA